MHLNILLIKIQSCAQNFQCYTYKYKSKGRKCALNNENSKDSDDFVHAP